MGKLLITLTTAILVLNLLTFVFVVTTEPLETAESSATKGDRTTEGGRATEAKAAEARSAATARAVTTALEPQLRALSAQVEKLGSSDSQLLRSLQGIERRVATIERELQQGPVAEPVVEGEILRPNSGPSRIEFSQPPESTEAAPEDPLAGPGDDAVDDRPRR